MHQLPLPDSDSASALLQEIFSREPAQPTHDNAHSVVLYGAGELGRLALDFLIYVGVKVEFALDRAASDGDLLGGIIPVYRQEQSPCLDNHLILVTTVNVPYSEISEQLKKRGLMRVLPFYDYALQFADRHPLNNGWFSGPLTIEDQRNITKVMAGFEDARSRAAYLQFLAWRVLREDWVFDDAIVFNGDRFFIGPIQEILSDEECFLDVGAYDGRAFLHFLTVTGEKFNSALLIEPDEKNFLLLQQSVEKLPQEIMQKITLLKGALASASGKHCFAQGFDFASRLWDIKQGEVKVFRLDNLKFPFSFIKMHIEGAEYEALKGGLTHIKTHRPVLAITVYHNRDGLWKTPMLLQETLLEYIFVFKMHSWCGTGAVIYGIPKERFHNKNVVL